jgi:hypothetical protein
MEVEEAFKNSTATVELLYTRAIGSNHRDTNPCIFLRQTEADGKRAWQPRHGLPCASGPRPKSSRKAAGNYFRDGTRDR